MKDSTPSQATSPLAQPATSDPLVQDRTTYSRMIVSAEEIERQLLAAYGPNRMPGTESRRRSHMGLGPREPAFRTCAQCGEPLKSKWRPRFCSQDCYGEWVEAHPPQPIPAGVKAEMQAALDELRAYVEDEW